MGILILGLILLAVIVYYLYKTMTEYRLKVAEKAVEQGNLDVALSIFMDSLRRNPDNLETLWHLGNINEEKGNYPEAIGYYTQIIQKFKESPLFSKFEVLKRIANLYHKIDRDKEALDYYLQAYSIIRTAKDVLKNIALIVLSQKQYYRALPFFERGSPYLRDDPEFLKYYGICLLMVDNVNDAVIQLEEARKLVPNDMEAKYLLAYAYFRYGAYSQARELIEEVANSDKIILTLEQRFFTLKMLTYIYMLDGNYDVARELQKKMEVLLLSYESEEWREETSMMFIILRANHQMYDMALERVRGMLELEMPTEGLSEDEISKNKERRSMLYELLSILDKYTKEKAKFAEDDEQKKQLDLNFSMLEAKALEAKQKLDDLFKSWQQQVFRADLIYNLFHLPVSSQFDPVPILDKYSEETMKAFRQQSQKTPFHSKPLGTPQPSVRTLGINPQDPCQSIIDMDFSSFILFSRDLAERMGYRVVNTDVKADPIAYSEGRGVDLIVEELTGDRLRILFALRRWRQPIGYIAIMNLLSSLSEFYANKLVIVSTMPLNEEAQTYVSKDSRVSFILCDDIGKYLS